MRRNASLLPIFLGFASLLVSPTVRAQETVVPAGTLLRCTMSEPNFSSATAQVGDPVLCHLAAVLALERLQGPVFRDPRHQLP